MKNVNKKKNQEGMNGERFNNTFFKKETPDHKYDGGYV